MLSWKSASALIMSAVLASCALTQPPSAPLPTVTYSAADVITIILPPATANGPTAEQFIRQQLPWESAQVVDGGVTRLSTQLQINGEKFIYTHQGCGWVSNSSGTECNPMRKGAATMTGRIKVERQQGRDVVSLIPEAHQITSTRNLLTGSYHFPWLEVPPDNLKRRLFDLTYQQSLETDSPYPVDAVLGNFKRLAKLVDTLPNNQGYVFRMQILENRTVDVRVVVNAYRNGSKVTMTAFVPPKIHDKTADFTAYVPTVIERIIAIIKA